MVAAWESESDEELCVSINEYLDESQQSKLKSRFFDVMALLMLLDW